MKIIVEDVFVLQNQGLVTFDVSVIPPAELKKGWYSLKISGEAVTTFCVGGHVHFTPYNSRRPQSIWTRDIEKIRPYAFEKGAWELEPTSEPE